MSYVTVIWSVLGAGSLLLAVMYGLVWAMDRTARPSLAFAFESLSIVGSVVVELGMMYSTTPGEWGEWVRWAQIPIFVRTVALVAFIRFYFGTGRSWLIWTIVAARSIVLIAGFLTDPNFNFVRIDSIDRIPFLGEQVTVVGQAVVSPYQWFATAATYLVLVFVLDASITLWRRGTHEARRKAIVIGGAIFLAWILASTLSQLVIYGIVSLPVLISPPDLIVIAAMTLELSRDTLRASRLAAEQARTRQQLEELQRELTHAGRVSALGTLSSSLAHELSQPLTAILMNSGSANRLLNMPDPDREELREILGEIRRDGQRAVEVIERLRALLRRGSLEFAPVPVEGLLKETSVLLKSDALARKVTLEFDGDAGLPAVHGDKIHLTQVLINLIINGMDAVADLPADRRRVSVRAYAAERDSVELAVSDSGGGIPPDALQKIFEPFYTSKATGMGMGLSISRTIVEAHGGRIWAENRAENRAENGADRGATFRLRLPTSSVDEHTGQA
ncbi:MAG TPA: ATP-binding protein [Thermoanaerobaculia bacterium]